MTENMIENTSSNDGQERSVFTSAIAAQILPAWWMLCKWPSGPRNT